MNTEVIKNGDVIVIHVSGKITYQSVDPFRENCLKNLQNGKVVFNLQNLNFVGSNGITTFVSTIQDVAKSNPAGVRLCGVSSEFKKIFAVGSSERIQVFEDQGLAEYSFLEDNMNI